MGKNQIKNERKEKPAFGKQIHNCLTDRDIKSLAGLETFV